jgi:hypothetical protein
VFSLITLFGTNRNFLTIKTNEMTKKISFALAVALLLILFNSCRQEFLTQENENQKNLNNYKVYTIDKKQITTDFKLFDKIAKLQNDLEKIENGESVIDTVSGGMGGTQHFKIEGVPYPEYGRKRTLLYSRMTTLQLLQDDLLKKTNDVEEFIASLDDSRMRRIINFRFLENKSWLQTAYALGGKATADSVRMEFERFFKKM